ncbi:MAG TPA: adenylate/guanylate cyclase domain-containing protein [bacterium]|nr:adenylate/guanylate cyclase domain-containing protein [bacterium]
MSAPEDRFIYRPKITELTGWAMLLFGVTAGFCFYLTQDPGVSVEVGSAGAVFLIFSWMDLSHKSQRGLYVELQQFLLRCKILPADYKIDRNPSLSTLEKRKKEFMDMAAAHFQQSEKKLTEARYVLDRFVGTKGSQFATEKGRQAVWEGQVQRAIVLFSDVRGFTSMTEKLKPQETVRFLNRMFTEFEEVLAFAGGEINKFIGDAVLCFFPFPEDNPEPAVKRAILAGLRLQDAFHQIQGTFRETYSESVHTGLGVGMAGGEVILGNLGSARRMEFTLIGDTVNLASRLCSIAEDGQVLVNQDLAQVAADSFRMEALEPVRLKGKTGTYRPYSVTGEMIRQGLA